LRLGQRRDDASLQLGQSARRRLVVVLQTALVVALQEADQAPVASAPRVGRRDPDRLGTIGGRAFERLAYCSAKAGVDDVMPGRVLALSATFRRDW
jgi:hypothetical protein